MSDLDATNGYSADVRLELILDGKRFEPTQVGEEFLMLEAPAILPAGPAELILTVDGRPRHWRIDIPEMRAASRTVQFRFAQQDTVHPSA